MMSQIDLVILGCLLAATMIAPLLMLRRGRTPWGMAEAVFWIATALSFSAIRLFEIELPGSLIFSIIFVVRIAMFVGLVLCSDGSLRWNAVRAGVAAGFVYILLVPHVLQWPIDGDEPFFLLVTESLVQDVDLDLANQYQNLDGSETGRLDLEPQIGDPVGEDGEIRSRHEPFLSLLLIPGYLTGGLAGAVATIAMLGGLLVVSLLKLLEEKGHPRASRSLVWPAIALAPPILFYATRIWAEVPGALAFSEAIRAMHGRRWGRFVAWLLVLSLLQLRFGVLAAGLMVVAIVTNRPPAVRIAIGAAILLVPFGVLWIATGSPIGVHQTFEMLPMNPADYVRGLAGLIVDAQGGLLFQAPFWLLACLVLVRREDRSGLGFLWLAGLPYLILLLPRAEWHGGWSPPLRYLVVFAPIVALSLARVLEWLTPQVKAVAAIWTAGVLIHGIAFPWRLFHIASGESILGEALSARYGIDFSRLLPSVIRFNIAAVVWLGLLVALAAVLIRFRDRLPTVAVTVGLCAAIGLVAMISRQPGTIVHLEDAHVERRGGQLYPERWTVARFRFRGGWMMPEGATARFRIRPGSAVIDYMSAEGAVIEIGGRRLALPPTEGFGTMAISIQNPEIEMRTVEGSVVIDRVKRD